MNSAPSKKVDGKAIAEDILRDVGVMAPVMQKRVAFIQFGDDAASTQFIARKERVASGLGIQSDIIHESAVATTEAAIAVLEEAIAHEYDGIVVQLPMPYGIDTDTILNMIPPERDIDVLSKSAIEAFARGQTERMPPVAGAVDAVIKNAQIDLSEKNIVIVGKGRLVGAPIALLFDRMNVPYTALDLETPPEEQKELLLNADIVISGIGVAGHIQPHMVKDGVILIDAGTSEQGGVLVGDVDPACFSKATLYTTVPGGVGPVTVAVLLRNIFL
ncbi:MAG TPA: bifunctional 5,10-methylenetetrahydrofolate dehydrogenase/5,10-methenyltetrahydrofolate cyclohydrolase [Candidatus Paceibacterota bacterium]